MQRTNSTGCARRRTRCNQKC